MPNARHPESSTVIRVREWDPHLSKQDTCLE